MYNLKIVNLLGERVAVFDNKTKEWNNIDPDGLATVISKTDEGPDPRIRFNNNSEILGLPDPQENTYYIVPVSVKAQLVGTREDLLEVPPDAIEKNNVLYCFYLIS